MIKRMVLSWVFLAVCLQATTGARSPVNDQSKIQMCTELLPGRAPHPGKQKAGGKIACLWHKRTLKVRFLEGDPAVKEKVQRIAMEWTQYSHIPFVFGDSVDADIRITFDRALGSWSYIGSCQPHGIQATMNFGWLDSKTDDSEYQRVVLHEFGHALGLIHEHQSPVAKIPWNVQAVYDYYEQTQGWDRATVDRNIFQKYAEEETNHTTYDPKSIMQYAIPRELTNGVFEAGWNATLSELDQTFISEQYATR